MKKIKQILMERDGISSKDADQLIADAKRDFDTRLDNGEMPMNICEEWFGLEPDYLEEFLIP